MTADREQIPVYRTFRFRTAYDSVAPDRLRKDCPNPARQRGGLFEILFPVIFVTIIWRGIFLRDPADGVRILCDQCPEPIVPFVGMMKTKT